MLVVICFLILASKSVMDVNPYYCLPYYLLQGTATGAEIQFENKSAYTIYLDRVTFIDASGKTISSPDGFWRFSPGEIAFLAASDGSRYKAKKLSCLVTSLKGAIVLTGGSGNVDASGSMRLTITNDSFLPPEISDAMLKNVTVSASKGQKLICTSDVAVFDVNKKYLRNATKGQILEIAESVINVELIPVEIVLEGRVVIGYVPAKNARVLSRSSMVMTDILVIMIHVLVIGGIVLMLVFMLAVIHDSGEFMEGLLRTVSLASGLLAYTAARAYGISIPDIMSSAINTVSPFTSGLYSVIAPAVTGVFVAWFCIRAMKKSDSIGKRVVLLFFSFIFVMFSDVYATLAGEIGQSEGKYGLPNSTFVLGVVFYTIFNYEKPATKKP